MSEAGPCRPRHSAFTAGEAASPAALITLAAALLIVGGSVSAALSAVAAPDLAVHSVLYGLDALAVAALGVAVTTSDPNRGAAPVEQFDGK